MARVGRPTSHHERITVTIKPYSSDSATADALRITITVILPLADDYLCKLRSSSPLVTHLTADTSDKCPGPVPCPGPPGLSPRARRGPDRTVPRLGDTHFIRATVRTSVAKQVQTRLAATLVAVAAAEQPLEETTDVPTRRFHSSWLGTIRSAHT